jgi:hypothetical protein
MRQSIAIRLAPQDELIYRKGRKERKGKKQGGKLGEKQREEDTSSFWF